MIALLHEAKWRENQVLSPFLVERVKFGPQYSTGGDLMN